ncbi:MAG: DUF302 domain-containing protein [Armatimonadota bacterium]
MVYEKPAHGSLEEVLARLDEAVTANKFGVLSQLDLRAKLLEKGVEFASVCWIFEVCNPVQAKRVLEQEIGLATFLPCRISVYERDGNLQIGTLLPTKLLATMNQPALMPVAEEVEATILRIIDQACG